MADPKHIESLLENYIDHGLDGDIGKAIRGRVPFRLGGLTNCFQQQEKELRATKQVLEALNRYECPYLIVTKSPFVAEYTDAIEE
jgi:DNA repair photolyase